MDASGYTGSEQSPVSIIFFGVFGILYFTFLILTTDFKSETVSVQLCKTDDLVHQDINLKYKTIDDDKYISTYIKAGRQCS